MADDQPVIPVDYTEMAHHEDVPDPRDTGDISRPNGWFWRPEECDRGRRFMSIPIPGVTIPGQSESAPDDATR